MIESAGIAFIALLIGFVIGWRARASHAVPQAQLTGQPSRVGNVRPCDLDWWERDL